MKISGHETLSAHRTKPSTCSYQHSQQFCCKKPKKGVIGFVPYLLLGGEEKDAAVQGGAGRSALLLQAGWLHQLLGTACCTEPSLSASQASST